MQRTQTGGRPQSGNTVAKNLRDLRARRDLLDQEIKSGLFIGRPLTAEERDDIRKKQEELRGVMATLRMFEA